MTYTAGSVSGQDIIQAANSGRVRQVTITVTGGTRLMGGRPGGTGLGPVSAP